MISRRVFRGRWLSAGETAATTPAHVADVVVDKSSFSPTDIFVAAGCQQGFLHLETALDLCDNIIEAVREASAELAVTYNLELISPKGGGYNGRVYNLVGVKEIVSINSQWTAFDANGRVLSGPHNQPGWKFRFVRDTTHDNLMARLNRKEVKTSGPQTGEPEPTA